MSELDWVCTACLTESANVIIEGKDRLISAFRKYAELEAALEDFDCPHDAEGQCDCGRRQHDMYLRARKMRDGLLLGTKKRA
jgi:hypothetical protein